MTKRLLVIVGLFIVGVIGGIFADQILWPYFIERPLFYKYRLEQAPIYVTERKEITIEENTALQDAVEKVGKTIVNIRSTVVGGKIVEGTGMIISSDGLVVTLADLVPSGSTTVVMWENNKVTFDILKRDPKINLAVIKINEKNLPTTGFADLTQARLGERIFLLSATVVVSGTTHNPITDIKKSVREGIISSLYGTNPETSITGTLKLKGSPLFDIGGKLLGLSLVSDKGDVSIMPISVIRAFMGM
ncbi:MAG: S1C family serine protease [bacterium]